MQELLLFFAVLSTFLHAVKRLLDLFGVVIAGIRIDLGVVKDRSEGAFLEFRILTLSAETQGFLFALEVAMVVVEL